MGPRIISIDTVRAQYQTRLSEGGDPKAAARSLLLWVGELRDAYLPHDGDLLEDAHRKMLAYSFLVADVSLVIAEAGLA